MSQLNYCIFQITIYHFLLSMVKLCKTSIMWYSVVNCGHKLWCMLDQPFYVPDAVYFSTNFFHFFPHPNVPSNHLFTHCIFDSLDSTVCFRISEIMQYLFFYIRLSSIMFSRFTWFTCVVTVIGLFSLLSLLFHFIDMPNSI